MVMDTNSARMLTSTELARFLNIHINTVRRWTDQGLLKSYRIGPRRDRRFSQEDVINFLRGRPDPGQAA
jgi:excisionase family DNA binding protein